MSPIAHRSTLSWRILAFASATLVGGALASAATVTTAPTSMHPRGVVTVSGSGFAANELVDVYGDTVDMALKITDGAGAFTDVTLTLDNEVMPGKHWITVIGRKSGTAAQKSFMVRTDWPMARFGSRAAGRNPFENVLDISTVGRLGPNWKIKAGTAINAPPVIQSGYAYIGTSEGRVTAYNAGTGTLLWRYNAGTAIAGSPTSGGGQIYAVTTDGHLRAFNYSSGAVKWVAPNLVGEPTSASPVYSDGAVYVMPEPGFLTRINATTGAMDWQVMLPVTDAATAAPAVVDGVVYVGSTDGNLYARNAATGAGLWAYSNPDPIRVGPPAVVGGRVIFSAGGSVHALDEAGVWHWSTQIPNWGLLSAVAVDGDHVYVVKTSAPSDPAVIAALDVETGTIRWSTPIGHSVGVAAAPVIANGLVYLGTSDRKVRAFDTATGTRVWSVIQTPTISVPISPIVVDGKVYVTTGDGLLATWAVDAGAAALRAEVAAAKRPNPTALVPDGRLVPQP